VKRFPSAAFKVDHGKEERHTNISLMVDMVPVATKMKGLSQSRLESISTGYKERRTHIIWKYGCFLILGSQRRRAGSCWSS
jgi:hypothetical protein